MLFLVCDCHAEGTMDESNGYEKCFSNNGTCDCNEGYFGPRCDQCAGGYYSSNSNPLECSGKNQYICVHRNVYLISSCYYN